MQIDGQDHWRVEDHAHILFNLARTIALADVVEKVKTSSSNGSRLREIIYEPSVGKRGTVRSQLAVRI